jgi:hypothetical protein
MLRSKLLSPNARLRNCEVSDPAHVKLGDQGDFVDLIQRALALIDNVVIASTDTSSSLYGDSTAAAVLAYKTKRNIVNRSYENQADNIVGKMTVQSLDAEMLNLEGADEPVVMGAVRPVSSRLI